MDKTRVTDLNRLESDLKKETRPGVKKIISEAYTKVRSQSNDSWLKSAREVLARESSRNSDNMKQVHEDIKKHEKKNMGIGRSTFFFDLSKIGGYKHGGRNI
jgi:predicted metal-dependent TIM-barrel fold hydrolase